ncbi:MAG TPA: ABC transporter ATP-binding protein [Acidimicrobiales bacterium]|nr:ABC transporter ATP-binding protein [Acidimicrobiales bacterium]
MTTQESSGRTAAGTTPGAVPDGKPGTTPDGVPDGVPEDLAPDLHGAAAAVLAASAPPGSSDEARPRSDRSPDEVHILHAGALAVLRRGLAATPELRQGIALTAVMALTTAAGKLAVPILIQQILDRGVRGDAGFRPGFVYTACAVTAAVVLALYLASRWTYLRLVRAAENSLLGLRVRTFDHIHRLSMAEHNDSRRGALVARVTSDVETLAQFMEWGAVAWIVDSVVIAATFAVMAAYDWRLALLALASFVPLAVLLPRLQRRQLAAQDRVRDAVGETLSEVSETITGAALVQAYGLEERARARLRDAIDRQFRAYLAAARYFALMFPLGDVFGAVALAAVASAGVAWGPGWGLEVGEVIAYVFLIGLLITPLAELSEILDQTQIALSGWRKVLGVLATPLDVPEPAAGRELPPGPLDVRVDGLSFAYRDGVPVLRDVDVRLAAGQTVAVVGETGSGKTTFAKLLCRLADPVTGSIALGGVDLREVAPEARRRAVRLVPQDGFLFEGTIADNVRVGLTGTGGGRTGDAGGDGGDGAVRGAFRALGLDWWLDELPLGLDTPVGERGGNLSVGERQLVALARAQLGDPGLLVLDEATSAVDPETERALTQALDRLSAGRTMISIAHRLSTAEAAGRVLVFDGGRIVESGTHAELVSAGGTYASLYESWLGNTRGQPGPGEEAGGPTAPISAR